MRRSIRADRLRHLMAVALAAVAFGAAAAAPAGNALLTSKQAETTKAPKRAEAVDEFFARGPFPNLHVEITPPDLEKLRRDPRGYVPATVREVGPEGGRETVYEKVAVHLKGGAGSFRGVDDRPGLTLNFKLYAPDRKFHGLERFHLNNSVQDSTYMSENLGNALFRDAGIPAARVTYARARLNGRDLGVMVLKESFGDGFLKHFFDDPSGTLYEGGFCADIDAGLSERVNTTNKKPEKVKELIDAARERDPAVRRSRLAAVLDVDRFLAFMAVESLTAHWDGYCANVNNYRVYHDPASNGLVFLPHGTDQLFGQPGFPLVAGRGMVARALTEDPESRSRYLDRLAELSQRVFTPAALGRRLDEIAERLAPLMAELGPDASRRHKEQTESLRQRVIDRAKNVEQQLAAMPWPLRFGADGVASLGSARWTPQQGGGRATLDRVEEAGKPRLRIRIDGGGGESVASFRTTVLLTKGSYVLEGPCRTTGVSAPDGQDNGAGLRISGGRRNERRMGDSDWAPAQFTFEVSEPTREVVLVCELKATAGEAWFDPEGLQLRRR